MPTPKTNRRATREVTAVACEAFEPRRLFATVPSGFTDQVLATGLSSPTAMERAPNGLTYVAQQEGKLAVLQGGLAVQADFFANTPLAVGTYSERGLLGVAFDPNFNTNRYVYVYYTTTAADGHNRVSRFTANLGGDLALAGSESVITELDPHSAGQHNGGAIHFGADGYLYIATGDNVNGANAQSLENRHGKMLRIDVTGDDFPDDAGQNWRVPAGQPTSFAGIGGTTSGVNRAIYAVGLRNPFTFAVEPGTGRIFVNDVGQNVWEEIDELGPGRNFGWSTTEGPFDPAAYPNFTQPFYAYDHGGAAPNGIAITGGAFYKQTIPSFPASYTNDYFFSDYGSNTIWNLDLETKTVEPFATGTGAVVDLRADSGAGLLYLDRGLGELHRIAYAAPPAFTQQPADATVASGGTATFTVSANGSTSLSYQWQRAEAGTTAFANIDGATGATLALNNVGATDNGDRFRAIVTDKQGRSTASAFATLTVSTPSTNKPPVVSAVITGPLRNGKFDAGKAISFYGSVNDPEQGKLPASAYTWRVDYLTDLAKGDPDNDGLPGITRPFVAPFSNSIGTSFKTATTGPYTLADVAYVLTLTGTDAQGATATSRAIVYPNVVNLTIATAPNANLSVTLDGQPTSAPTTVASVVGFQRTIGTTASQSAGGTGYSFTGWSDGGALTHVVSTPQTDATYTASFTATTTPPPPPTSTPPTVTAYSPSGSYPLNASTVNVDVTFSKPITGLDASDLYLNGTATKYKSVAEPTYLGDNKYRFVVSKLISGAVYVTLAPDAGDIKDLDGNDVAPTKWVFYINIT